MKTVKFFKNNNEVSPVEEFLDALSSKQAKKVAWVMQLLEDLEEVPTTYFKKLVNTNGIWEICIQIASNAIRILGFLDGDYFIATNGFVKKTQKTPSAEIELAEKRKKEYLMR